MKRIIYTASIIFLLTLSACYPFIRDIPDQTVLAAATVHQPEMQSK